MNVLQELLTDSKQQGSHHLLVVPRSDVVAPPKRKEEGALSNNNQATTNDNTESPSGNTSDGVSAATPPSPPKYLLLQLPNADWTAHDLKQAHIVVNRGSTTSDTTTTPPASLIVEGSSRNASYALHKVETSNAWVLLPPQSSEEKQQVAMPAVDETQPAASKRLKHHGSSASSSWLKTTHARLLQQGSGASFLELRPKTVPVQSVYQHLLLHYSKQGESQGCSVSQLANALGSTRAQIKSSLSLLQRHNIVVALPPDKSSSSSSSLHGLWDKRLLSQIQTALVAALTEVCPNYVAQLPPQDEFVQLVQERLPHRQSIQANKYNNNNKHDEEHERWMIHQVVSKRLYQTDEQGHVAGNVEFVARLVAQEQLFSSFAFSAPSSRTAWNESDLWERWQMEMPGTSGDLLQARFLQGLAVRRELVKTDEVGANVDDKDGDDSNDNSPHETQTSAALSAEWIHFPVTALLGNTFDKHNNNNSNQHSLSEAVARFATVQKATWTKHELDPYLSFLASWFGTPSSAILQQYFVTQKDANTTVGVELFSLRRQSS